MLRLSPALAAVMLLVVASSASAQVFYMPVQYQHGTAMKYYYGGSDPAMHAYAEQVACRNGLPSVLEDHYSSLKCTLGQIGEKRVILSDCLPLRNAAVYGYREHDAANEAGASVQRFFRMRDQLDGAVPAADGTLMVPAHAPRAQGMADTAATTRPTTAPTRGAPRPRAIIILPKKAPQRDADHDTKAVKFVASAK